MDKRINEFFNQMWANLYQEYGCEESEECVYGIVRLMSTVNQKLLEVKMDFVLDDVAYSSPEEAKKVDRDGQVVRLSKKKWMKAKKKVKK